MIEPDKAASNATTAQGQPNSNGQVRGGARPAERLDGTHLAELLEYGNDLAVSWAIGEEVAAQAVWRAVKELRHGHPFVYEDSVLDYSTLAIGALTSISMTDVEDMLRKRGVTPPTREQVLEFTRAADWRRDPHIVLNEAKRAAVVSAMVPTLRRVFGADDDRVDSAAAELAKVQRLHRYEQEDKPPRARRLASLGLTGSQLFGLGFTNAEIAGLPEATEEEFLAALDDRAAVEAAERYRANEAGRALVAVTEAADIEIPDPIDFTSYTRSPNRWLIEGVLPPGHIVGLFAGRKVGKTTTLMEPVRSALDGVPMFGVFGSLIPPGTPIVVIDSEMTTDDLFDLYDAAGIKNLHRASFFSLKGIEASFDPRSAANRKRWAQKVPHGALLVVDCLYAFLQAVGIRENDDAAAGWLIGLRAFAEEIGAIATILVHHYGKDQTRGARGHSSIEGFVSVMWRITTDADEEEIDSSTPRWFSAFGRGGVDVPRGRLSYDGERVTFVDNAANRSARRDRVDARVFAAIETKPGRTRGDVEEAAGLSGKDTKAALGRLDNDGLVENRGTDKKHAWHVVDGLDGAAGDLFTTTAAERARDLRGLFRKESGET